MTRSDEGLDDVNEPVYGWSNGGDLIVKASTDWANDASRVGLAANFSEPGVYTVNISATVPNNGGIAGITVRTLALVEWSVGGNTVSRLVSVGQSTSISAPAQGVKVSVYDDSSPFALTPGQPAVKYQVSISVTKGTRVAGSRPLLAAKQTFTELFPIPAVQLSYPVPAGVGVIGVVVLLASSTRPWAVIPDNMIQLQQTSRGNGVGSCDPRQFEYVPLDPSTTDVYLYNSGTFSVFATLYFVIDG